MRQEAVKTLHKVVLEDISLLGQHSVIPRMCEVSKESLSQTLTPSEDTILLDGKTFRWGTRNLTS